MNGKDKTLYCVVWKWLDYTMSPEIQERHCLHSGNKKDAESKINSLLDDDFSRHIGDNHDNKKEIRKEMIKLLKSSNPLKAKEVKNNYNLSDIFCDLNYNDKLEILNDFISEDNCIEAYIEEIIMSFD